MEIFIGVINKIQTYEEVGFFIKKEIKENKEYK